MINSRHSELSSKKNIFNSIRKDYDDALTSGGHNRLIGYDKSNLISNSNTIKNIEKNHIFQHSILQFCID